MRKLKFIILAIVVLFAGFFLWSFFFKSTKPTPQGQQTPTHPPSSSSDKTTNVTQSSGLPRKSYAERKREDLKMDWKTPISFYGKVVDENERPVGGAQIKFVWNDLSPTGTSETNTISDKGGLFTLVGVRGKRLYVSIDKDGYYLTKRHSQFSFEFANEDEDIYHIPNPASPVIFHLKKKGETEGLIRREKNFAIPKNGVLVGINLLTAKKAEKDQVHLQVECWTSDQNKDRMNRYNWRCRITVPNGGLVESTKEFDFQAPESGYRPSDEIEMPMALGEKWKSDAEKTYFLKLRDGNFARLKFEMIAGGDHFCALEYYLNPTGSRNLEYDPAKEIKPGK